MAYTEPNEVTNRKRWKWKDTLYDGGPGAWAAAEGNWDGRPRLALRWNGTDEKPIGNPQSSAKASWFIVPDELEDSVRRAIREMS